MSSVTHRCSRCKFGKLEVEEGKKFGICEDCGAIEMLYNPQTYQADFHRDTTRYKGLFGGYGTGKTTSAVAEVIDHCISVPNGLTLLLAQTLPNLTETVLKEFRTQLPESLIAFETKKQGSESITLVNGHKIIWRASNNAGNLRSLNLTCFYMEEASEIDYSVFAELKARLRNDKALVFKTDPETREYLLDENGRRIVLENRLLGVICSNPDIGWIRNEFLLKSKHIYGVVPSTPRLEVSEDYSSHVWSTDMNQYLPPDFISNNAFGKPEWWVKRYLYGSFDYSEGMVYPDFSQHIVQWFDIPPTWTRLASADFGLRDATVMLMFAIDPETGVVYCYDEHYKSNLSVRDNATAMNKMLDAVPHGMLRGQPVGDPSGQQRSKNDLRSLYDHYREYGIYFKPGVNDILSGLSKVYTYFSLGRLKIFETCSNTVREGLAYKYKTQELSSNKNFDEKPIDKDNHAMDCLRYAIQELPDNPDNLISRAWTPSGLNWSITRFELPPEPKERGVYLPDDY